jgi:hypothetical protein
MSAAVSARPAADGAVRRGLPPADRPGQLLGIRPIARQQVGLDAQHCAHDLPRVQVRLGFLARDLHGQFLDGIDDGR